MSLINKIILLILFSGNCLAQTESTALKKVKPEEPKWSLGLSTLQFNETINLQKNVTLDTGTGNYRGALFQALTRKIYKNNIGYGIGFFAGSGKAVATAGPGVLSYSGNSTFLMYGISPQIYYQLTPPISLGITGMIANKKTDWGVYQGNITADSAAKNNFGYLFDVNFMLSSKLELTQGFGSLGKDATVWRLGLNYSI